MKKRLVLIGVCCWCTWGFAQEKSLVWAKEIHDAQYQTGVGVAVDRSGSIFVTGGFSGFIAYDSGTGTDSLVAAGEMDVYITKLDSGGNLRWARRLGGPGSEYVRAIAVDGSGNVYTAGEFSGTADFDPGEGVFHLQAAEEDIFLSKLDANGDFLWAISIGGAANGDFPWAQEIKGQDWDRCAAIAVDALGNAYITGGFCNDADFDPHEGTSMLTTKGYHDAFIAKYDASGNLVWARQMGNDGFDMGDALCVDGMGNVIVTGSFWGTVDFDPGPAVSSLSAANMDDNFICKMDGNGKLIWTKVLVGDQSNEVTAIATDTSGSIYLTGHFCGTMDLDPGHDVFYLTSSGLDDIFIEKLSPDGGFVWARQIGDKDVDIGQSMAVDLAGCAYITGQFSESPVFCRHESAYQLRAEGSSDLYVCKFSTWGDFQGVAQIGGKRSMASGQGIALDAGGHLITLGSFSGRVDLDSRHGRARFSNRKDWGVFMLKMKAAKL